jgi:hypothetical protein
VDHEEEQDPGYARKQKAIESLPVLPDDYGPLPLERPQFLATKEHRRFTEFADATGTTATSACATARRVSARPSQPGSTPTGTNSSQCSITSAATTLRYRIAMTSTRCSTRRPSA